MKVEVLYFDGCPTYEAAEKTLRDVFADKGLEADVELVAVNTDEEAPEAALSRAVPPYGLRERICSPPRSVRTSGGWAAECNHDAGRSSGDLPRPRCSRKR